MKPVKNTKKTKNKSQAANKFLKKKKLKKGKKLQSFAAVNLLNIKEMLAEYKPDDDTLLEEITKFMDSIMQGEACNLSLPAHIGPGLASLLLNNMAYWLGNTQATLKTKSAIDELGV